MRVLVLDTSPWRELGIVRTLERANGITPCLERDLSNTSPRAAVVLVSEHAVRAGERRSIDRLRTDFPDARILVLGDNAKADEIADLVSSGADGYFNMALGDAKLASAINVVARGSFWLPDEAVASVVKKLRAVPEALDTAQRALVDMLDEGLTSREMAARLSVAEITVRSRLSRLYRRFHVRTRRQLVTELRRRGFIAPH